MFVAKLCGFSIFWHAFRQLRSRNKCREYTIMVLVPLILCGVVPEFLRECFVGRRMDDITQVGKMVTPSVPIATAPAIIVRLDRGWTGNIRAMKGRRRR